MGFIKYSVSIMMIALFSVSIMLFAINFGIDNHSSVNLADDGYEGYSDDLQDEIDIFIGDVETAGDAYSESTISSQTEASEGGTQFKVTVGSSLNLAKQSLTASWEKIFGEGSQFNFIVAAIIGMLGFIMFALGYKAWVGRNPE